MPVFTRGQLDAVAHAQGGDVRFQREIPNDFPVLSGEQAVQALGNGLVLYISHSEDLINGDSQNLLPSGITAAFLLQGQADVSMAGQRQHFDARPGRYNAMLVNLTDSDQFHRHWRKGRQETKLCLCFSPDWLNQFEHDSNLRTFSRTHWQQQPWRPSADILQRAHRLMTQNDRHPLVQSMRRESFALDFATEVLQTIEAPVPLKRTVARLDRRLLRLKEWLDSGEADRLSISQMARQLGTNPVDLQNGFRARNGITIAAYLRRRRLEQAYRAIRQQSLSIEEAANLAGYEHLSSFSAAFKRQYGFPPSQARH